MSFLLDSDTCSAYLTTRTSQDSRSTTGSLLDIHPPPCSHSHQALTTASFMPESDHAHAAAYGRRSLCLRRGAGRRELEAEHSDFPRRRSGLRRVGLPG